MKENKRLEEKSDNSTLGPAEHTNKQTVNHCNRRTQLNLSIY